MTYLSLKKATFFVRIFDISHCVFTQISIGRARWMRNQRVPTLHTFEGPRYPKNKKCLKKHDDDVIITFFQTFLVFGVAGSIKSMQWGTHWMQNQIPHRTSSLDRNLRKNTMRYVENTNKKSSFFNNKYVKSTIMVDSFYWNSIGSWIPTHNNLLLVDFVIRPILDPKFPLMKHVTSVLKRFFN